MLNHDTLVTSSGIIKNRFKPRTGIVSAHSLYPDLFTDCLNRGIDLTWESFRNDLAFDIDRRYPDLDADAKDALFESESELIELDSRVFLYGAWVRNVTTGKYEIDKTGASGSFALEYNTETGIVCVEWSTETMLCGNTSPCYVMADGSGPCGDLNSEGDTITAYTLPDDMFSKDRG